MTRPAECTYCFEPQETSLVLKDELEGSVQVIPLCSTCRLAQESELMMQGYIPKENYYVMVRGER